MATLAAGIDATQTVIPVSGAAPETGSYLTVGTEAVRFLGTSRGPQGRSFLRSYWSVDRGVAGSTAASHLSGATFTQYYPDAEGTGDGGSVTADQQDALDGNASLNAGNPVASMADVGGSDPLHLDEYLSIGETTTATATLTLTAQPEVGDSVEIGNDGLYTFVAPVDFNAPLEISRGTNVATAVAAIIAAVNGTDGQNTASVDFVASSPSAGVVRLTAIAPGSAANDFFTGYTNIGAGTNSFAAENPEGGAEPATAGVIRLRADEFVSGDDGISGSPVQLIGYDPGGQYVCVGDPVLQVPVVSSGPFESRIVDTDTWLSSSSSRHIFHSASTAAAIEVRLDSADSADIVSLSDGIPVSLGPAGARLDNAAPLKIGTASPAAFHNLVVMTGANVLVFNVAGIPTSNPGVAGQVWSDAGTLKVSAG
jgi:hypothetical protein